MTSWTPADLLPGLWVAALAALLALGLRRWFDPIPRWCWGVWGGVLLVLFGPALFGGRVLLPLGYLTLLPPYRRASWEGTAPGNLLASDVVLQITPWLARVREAYAAGEWPLWNHLAGAGEPLLGNPQSQAFQPLAWLALPFPVPEAAGVIATLRVLVPLVFTFLFLRRQGISEAPALWGSLAFGLSGFLQLWLGWPLASSATFLPFLLYGLAMVARRGLGRDQVLLAAATACVVLVGHPETGLHVVLLGAAFALSLLIEMPAERRGALLRAWAVAGWVGLGLAAPALMTAADALPRSLRASLLAARHAAPITVEDESNPVGRLLPVAAPNAYGNNRFGHYWGNSNMNEDAAGFTGTAALLACLLAFAPMRKEKRLPQERVFLGAALVCLVVLARPPGLVQLLEALPVLRESYSYHSRLTMLLNFVIAYLAACTWERWRRSGLRPRPVLLAAAALAALILWGYLAHPHPEDPARLTLLRYGTLALQLAALAIFSVALARPSLPRWVPGLLALIVAGELLAVYAPVNPSLPDRLYYPETEPITFVRQRLDPWHRVAGVGGALRPNLPSVYGLADPRSSNPAKPAAYVEVTRRINRFPDRASDGFLHPEDPLYGLLGVRFVMTAPRLELPPPLKPVLRRPSGWVYRRPGALPRLFLPASATECREPRPWPDCIAAVRDFAETAMVRHLRGGSWKAAAPRGSTLDLGDLRPAHLRVRAHLTEPRLLGSSLYQDGGWRLLTGGKPLPAVTANGPFFAAWLPAGDTRLDLLYRPAGFLLGMAMAALALAGTVILWMPPPRRKTTCGPGSVSVISTTS